MSIRAICFDLDGTLYEGSRWIDGALDTVQWLIGEGYEVRFITNTSIKNRRQLHQRFPIDIPPTWIFTPALAAAYWLHQHTPNSVLPLIHSNLYEDLSDIAFTDDFNTANYVLVGDMDSEWTIDHLHHGLRALLNGAELIAIHQNRYWKADDGYRLDAGGFAAALAYGATTECKVLFGKPSPTLFEAMLADIGVPANEVLMVGDDFEADVQGGRACGLQAVLMKTGKFQSVVLDNVDTTSFAILPSVAHLRDYLAKP
jgi:HAD superfamily hydrolase (TIGR01458 family)